MKKSNASFLARRIQFKESTRVDQKQENLKKKYRPVNSPALVPSQDATSPSTTGPSRTSTTVATEDRNGFRFPAKILFNQDKVQLSWQRPRPIGPGLHNMGNTCFLNSVLQCLTYTAPLNNFLLSNQHKDSCKSTNCCMMCQLESHVSRCSMHGKNQPIAPKAIVGRLKTIGKQFRLGRQEDSHEFTRHLIDALQKSCLTGLDSKLDNRIKETTAIHQIFGGYFQSQVKCMKCGHESNTFETYLDVSLDIKHAGSIQKAFRDYTTPEILSKDNQYKCDKCKTLVDARKQMTIYDAPKVLCVHLKRFTYTGQKINRHVAFDTKLELNSFMSGNKSHPKASYSLYGVLVHSGSSCHSGHYYCYVKSSDGVWYCMDDSSVSIARLETVLNANAYMLFYTQDKGTPRPAKMDGPNGRANGLPKGASSASMNGKRSRPDDTETGDDDSSRIKRPKADDKQGKGARSDEDLGDKVDRSTVEQQHKGLGKEESENMSKEERQRLKKMKKKAKKLAKLARKTEASDYELATNPSVSAAPSESASSTSSVSDSTSKSIFGVPRTNGTTPSKSQSPLADLDDIFKSPTTQPKQHKPLSLSITTKPPSDWTITEGALKSPVMEELRQLQLHEQRKKERRNSTDEKDSSSDETEQDGWTVKPRVANPAVVVWNNESSESKRDKLQTLIEREVTLKSADAKEHMLNDGKHMLGSRISTWEETSIEVTAGRNEVLRSLKPKHHRPDAYDVDYDRGKVKKVKTKHKNGFGFAGKNVNKFQSEQDIKNLSKPKFPKNKSHSNQLPSEL